MASISRLDVNLTDTLQIKIAWIAQFSKFCKNGNWLEIANQLNLFSETEQTQVILNTKKRWSGIYEHKFNLWAV